MDPVELQVNTYTTDSQYRPALASAPDGSFVVAWTSRGSWGDDQSLTSVQMRRLSAGGTPLGPAELQVNTCTPSWQRRPKVGVDAVGDIVVVWDSGCSHGDDTDISIQARRFSRELEPLDALDFQVNTITNAFQWRPDVAVQPDGEFVVVWESSHSGGNDDSGGSIQARRYRADGTPLEAAEFQVNTFTWGGQFGPKVAARPGGGFVVAWSTYDADGYGVALRRYDAAGLPLDPLEVPVNAYTTDVQAFPRLAVAADGSFVVTWQSWGSFGSDNDAYSVQARRYDPDGQPRTTAEFQVNTWTTYHQYGPSVAVDAAGNFFVAWASIVDFTSGNYSSIRFRRYSEQGDPYDPEEIQANVVDELGQLQPQARLTPDGDPTLVWVSDVSEGGDDDFASIQAQRYRRPWIDVGAAQDPAAGGCSLADAIAAANTGQPQGDCPAGSGGGIVRLAPESVHTFQAPWAGASATPVVSTPMTILGRGGTVERDPGLGCPGSADFRLFEVGDGGLLSLHDVAVRNGCLPADAGGGLLATGGAVRLSRTRIADNRAQDGAGVALAGADLAAFETVFERNVASASGGGLATLPGASRLALARTTFAFNSATEGGGLALAAGTALELAQSTVSSNVATAAGGGLAVAGPADEVEVEYSTLAGNAAPMASALAWDVGPLRLRSALVGDGIGGAACVTAGGTVAASNGNLDTDGSCAALAGGGVVTVPTLGLGLLAANGGFPPTHLPMAGSPALDGAASCSNAAGRLVTDDARGYPRPTDDDGDGEARCDLGAVERSPLFLDGFESGDTSGWPLPAPPAAP